MERQRSAFLTLRSALSLIEPGRRFRWLVVVVAAILVSVAELISASLVYVLSSLIANPELPSDFGPLGIVTDFSEILGGDSPVLTAAGLLALFFVLRAVLQVGGVYLQARVAQSDAAHISGQLLHTYLYQPYGTLLGRNTSQLIRNAYDVPQQLASQVLIPFARAISDATLSLALLVFLFVVAPLPALIAVAAVGSVSVALLAWVHPRLRRAGGAAHDLREVTLRLMQQVFGSVREIKLSGSERHFEKAYRQARKPLATTQHVREVLLEVPRSSIELAVLLLVLLLLAILTVTAGDSAGPVLGTIGLFGYAGLRLVPSVQRIVVAVNSIRFASAPLAEIADDLKSVSATSEPEHQLGDLAEWSQVRFEDVRFRYDGADVDALSGVTVTIDRGESIGICGRTGGGKTTFVNLLVGLLEPSAGAVLVDDADLRDCRREWQRSLGLVPQDVMLLDDSIRRNVAFGAPDDQIDEFALNQAIERAQLAEWIGSLSDGVDSVVGERGVKLSGGQRQRIGIARALYRRPSVIVFDEGTSALDGATESAVMAAIDGLRRDHTVVIVAHRLSTVEECDRIFLIEGGVLQAQGTYSGLLDESAAFRTLLGRIPAKQPETGTGAADLKER